MTIPIFMAILISSVLLNFNILTLHSGNEADVISKNQTEGKVMGVSEANRFVQNPDHQNAINGQSGGNSSGMESARQFKSALSAILSDAREVAMTNLSVEMSDHDAVDPEMVKRGPRVKLTSSSVPDISAMSGAIYDVESGRYLFNKNSDQQRPIASITKLMTAMVFLDQKIDWNMVYEIRKDDKVVGGKIILFPGDKVRVSDLFNMSLVGSDNVATLALVHTTGMSEKDFVRKMNIKAAEMGLRKTYFEDVVGLSNHNVSTAKELAMIGAKILDVKNIRKAVLLPEYKCETLQGKAKRIVNTDNLIGNGFSSHVELMGGKTGYIESAGYCFMGKFTNGKNIIISVVLGSAGKNSRFDETKKMVNWTYGNFNWPD
jgi:serine-type D-Ala-D-Ala endopeptidase (penicillin-binding protein 7)